MNISYVPKKIGIVLILLFIFLLVYIITATRQKQEEITITKEQYQNAIDTLAQKLPIMLDSETELTTIRLKNSTIEYTYTLIDKRLAEVDTKAFAKTLQAEVIKMYCSNNDTMRLFREGGYSARYTYKDKLNATVLSISIAPKDCISGKKS